MVCNRPIQSILWIRWIQTVKSILWFFTNLHQRKSLFKGSYRIVLDHWWIITKVYSKDPLNTLNTDSKVNPMILHQSSPITKSLFKGSWRIVLDRWWIIKKVYSKDPLNVNWYRILKDPVGSYWILWIHWMWINVILL